MVCLTLLDPINTANRVFQLTKIFLTKPLFSLLKTDLIDRCQSSLMTDPHSLQDGDIARGIILTIFN